MMAKLLSPYHFWLILSSIFVELYIKNKQNKHFVTKTYDIKAAPAGQKTITDNIQSAKHTKSYIFLLKFLKSQNTNQEGSFLIYIFLVSY